LAAAFLLAACGREGNTGAGAPGEVVRAYVRALDERDGKRFCDLVAPYISGRYDLLLQDPDTGLPGIEDCVDLVSKLTGYVEDCGTPHEFKGSKLVAIDHVENRGELRLVQARVRLELEETCKSKYRLVTKTLHEKVWLAHIDGAWRVAKLGELAQTASLQIARLPEEAPVAGDERPDAPPDVAAEKRAYEAAADAFEQRMAKREASFQPVEDVHDCPGGMSVEDARHDQVSDDDRSAEAPDVPGRDLAGMDVMVDGRVVCVRWRLAGEVEAPLELTYSHGGGSSDFAAGFQVELREDGTARVTSGYDEHRHLITVPAPVGANENSVSLVLDPDSFEVARPYGRPHEAVELDSFTVMGSAEAPLTRTGNSRDPLGPDPHRPVAYRYPDGAACDSSC
jgi:hypothetical protein